MTQTGFMYAAMASYAVAAAVYLALAGRLAIGRRRSDKARVLMAASLATSLWAAFNILVATRPTLLAWLLSGVADSVRYALWFLFFDRILRSALRAGGAGAPSALMPLWAYVIAAAALVASAVLPWGAGFAPNIEMQARSSGFAIRIALAVFGLIMVEQLMRRAHAEARWALKPLCLGLGGLFAFDLFFYADAMLFNRLDADIWVARGITSALVVPFIAIATVRNTGWTIDMHVSRVTVFHSTALVVSGIFVLAIAAAGYVVRFFGGEFGTVMQIALWFGALLVTVLVVSSGRFHSKLRVFVSKHFFSYRYDYRAEWLRFTQTLSTESSVQSVEERCVKALADLVESPAGVIWLREDGGKYVPTNRWNAPAPVNAMEPEDAALPRFLLETGWVVNIAEYNEHPERYNGLVLPSWLASLPSAWLVISLASGNELVGFVVLTTPRAHVDVNWEVLDLLKTASRQAGSYIGQARATEALLEARKFAAFNRMSAFVVHDLKNLVSQLTLMLKNAERHRDKPEFQRDMLATVDHVVGRMNHLMLQLRSGTDAVEKPRIVDLERIVRRVCAAKARTTRPVRLDVAPGLTTVGHEEQLDHVIGHLVQNALDATASEGDVAVVVARGEPGVIVVEVNDTGVGMTADFVRDRLYKPFETTKPAGMGIGVYESVQYVRGIGGHIHIDSAPGEGTRVRVVLPAAESAPEPTVAYREVT